jgi:hypothetical protein
MVLKFYRAADEMINGRSLLLDLTQRPETKEPSGLRIFAGALKKTLGIFDASTFKETQRAVVLQRRYDGNVFPTKRVARYVPFDLLGQPGLENDLTQ